jgi:hypothetical protein
MNYFAHGYRFVHDPYFMAGTAIPDWLSVIDRRVRVRAKGATPHIDHADERISAVARGILQHLADDDWFHQTAIFNQLNVAFSALLRQHLSGDEGYRPAFLGHILVEILLDAYLIERESGLLDRYYQAMQTVEPIVIQTTINLIAVQPTDLMVPFLPRFIHARFLYDYLDDSRLLYRLNQVMQRVKLAPLPESFLEYLPTMRNQVYVQAEHLLHPPSV